MNIQDREKAVLEVLEELPKEDLVLVGGYALNAYVPPQFSVDCDLVVLGEPDAVEAKLEAEGFARTEEGEVPYGEYIRYVRDDERVSFDLLVGSVLDRQTGVVFEEDLFREHSARRTTVGRANPVRIELRVADPELLFAMKFVPGRRQDIRDLFMLAGEDLDWDLVADLLLERCSPEVVAERADLIEETVEGEDYRDSLQGPFGKIPDGRYERCRGRLVGFLRDLAEEGSDSSPMADP